MTEKAEGYWIAKVTHEGVKDRRFVPWSEFCHIDIVTIAKACEGWELRTGDRIQLTYGEAMYDTDNRTGVSR